MESKSLIIVSFILNLVLIGAFLALLYTGILGFWALEKIVPDLCSTKQDGKIVFQICDDSKSTTSAIE